MMYYTHVLFSIFVSLIAIDYFNIKDKVIFLLIALFFSLLPDIDESRSKIGRRNKLISKTIGFIFGHRGIFHTIYIPLVLFVLLDLINFEIAFACLIGYFSHLLLDALTKNGIKPFYPLFNIKIRGFFKTNSIFEKLFFLALVFVNLLIILKYIQ